MFVDKTMLIIIIHLEAIFDHEGGKLHKIT